MALPILAERLMRLRENRHLTQQDVSERTGIPQSTIGNYESGSHNPSLENLIKLASFYHVTTGYLLGIDEDTISVSGLTSGRKEIARILIDALQREQNNEL